ncbi:phage head closure protein [Roseivirga pacifica]|uniref:phage head closure protein n=1 Tax=Roseivirga pacifica TaxID=1267423 RepID=UPI002094C355|nr:phage head closure protein [Roseivirga pacifica]MCO6358550.1 phage head closure protein [Roseivirga pacifica]MCO6369105.1 phage head closure protein [Roseivirga pacifica]MCO6372191.1 phage head closure protein [Roseivirga pacifica]MCO6374281.1 phage head closure protein [Roseivirga pacifica]MCO6380922.1 phage head closure protein [Roseivirga pacifica]
MLRGINPGFQDRRITIQQNTAVQNSDGQPIEGWSDLYANVPAKRIYGSGGEKEDSGQLVPHQLADYEIRYASSITTNCRVVEAGQVYEVLSVQEIGRRQGLLLKCKWVGNGS